VSTNIQPLPPNVKQVVDVVAYLSEAPLEPDVPLEPFKPDVPEEPDVPDEPPTVPARFTSQLQ